MQNSTRTAALILALPGVFAPFLPFARFIGPISPLDTILPSSEWGPLATLGAPFFLAVPIAFWQARRLVHDRLSLAEIAGAYLLATGAMISVIAFTILVLVNNNTPLKPVEVLTIFLPWALVAANAVVLARNLSRRLGYESSAEVFLLGAYLPNAVFCLIAFVFVEKIGFHVGTFFVLFACIGYLISIVLVLREEQRPAVATSSI